LDPEEPVEFGATTSDNEARYSATEAAKVTTPEGQRELLSLCRAADQGKAANNVRCEDRSCLVLGRVQAGLCAANREVYRSSGVYITDDVLCATGRYCFMEDVARYWAFHVAGGVCKGRNNTGECGAVTSCDYGSPGASCCAWDEDFNLCYPTVTEHDYPGLPADDFVKLLGSDDFVAYLNVRRDTMYAYVREFDAIFDEQLTGYRLSPDGQSLSVAWVTFNATYPVQNTVEQANDWYDRWEAFRTEYAANLGGFQTTELYKFMVTQNEMVKAAVMGVCLSLVITYVILLVATANWWVSTLGLGNIIGIACVFLGLIPVVGWSLGENECIFLIAVVGLSVDYSVHLLHSYTHAKEGDRDRRSRHALGEMGISVISSSSSSAALCSWSSGSRSSCPSRS